MGFNTPGPRKSGEKGHTLGNVESGLKNFGGGIETIFAAAEAADSSDNDSIGGQIEGDSTSMVALNASDGSFKWGTKISDFTNEFNIHGSVAYVSRLNRIFFDGSGASSGFMTALEASGGSFSSAWGNGKIDLSGFTESTPLYIPSEDRVYYGSEENDIKGTKVDSTDTITSQQFPGGASTQWSNPSRYKDAIIATDNANGLNLLSLSFDLSTNWTFGGTDASNRFFIESAPLTNGDGTMFVKALRNNQNNDRDGYIYAINAETGVEEWVTRVSVDDSAYGIAIDDSLAFSADSRGQVTAVSQSDGSVVWTKDLDAFYNLGGAGTAMDAPPIVAGGYLWYTINSQRTIGLNPSNGDVEKDKKYPGGVVPANSTCPIYHNGTLYLPLSNGITNTDPGDPAGGVMAVDTSDMSTLWHTEYTRCANKLFAPGAEKQFYNKNGRVVT